MSYELELEIEDKAYYLVYSVDEYSMDRINKICNVDSVNLIEVGECFLNEMEYEFIKIESIRKDQKELLEKHCIDHHNNTYRSSLIQRYYENLQEEKILSN